MTASLRTEPASADLAIEAAKAADDKFGQNTLVIEVGDVLAVTERFVITSGSNKRQVKAIVDAIDEHIRVLFGAKPLRVEGLDTLEWVLIDYGAFVVHVFDEPTRAFYQLERLWGDRPRVDWQVA